MEFLLKQPVEECIPEGVFFNYDELKAEITAGVEKYKGMVVTQDTIKDAKADRATLNKLRTGLEDERKRIKKAWMQPYDAFEKQVKSLVGLIDSPVKAIDDQLQVYEKERKKEKLAAITELYNQLVSPHKDFVPLERICDNRWLNASYKLDDIESELMKCFDGIANDVLLIPDICPEDVDFAMDYYYRTLNISETKAAYTQAQDTKKKLKAQKEKQAAQAQRTKKVEAPPKIEPKAPQVKVSDATPEKEVYQLDFRVWVTTAQMDGLKAYLDSNGIKIGKVE